MAIIRFACKDRDILARMDEHAKKIYEYCDLKRLYIMEEVRFIEGGMGDASKRPRYTAAIQRAVATRIGHIVFYSCDRMSRDPIDDPISDLIKANLMSVHFVIEPERPTKEEHDAMVSLIRRIVRQIK